VFVRMRSNSGSKVSFGSMTAFVIGAAVLAVGLSTGSRLNAQAIEVDKILKGVEDRYNKTQSLQATFTETFNLHGRKTVEKGELFLRKPGRMRWQYAQPAGKLFISDGKYIYLYTPSSNQAERMPFKETEDLRAPLAFLLGRLHFQDDFREFQAQRDGRNVMITAITKSDKLPYSSVKFLVSPDSVIRYVAVTGQDNSLLEYALENEKKNPVIADSMFQFKPPAGVEYVNSK
jgi:outer membrane lipoprotein carrier protein